MYYNKYNEGSICSCKSCKIKNKLDKFDGVNLYGTYKELCDRYKRFKSAKILPSVDLIDTDKASYYMRNWSFAKENGCNDSDDDTDDPLYELAKEQYMDYVD